MKKDKLKDWDAEANYENSCSICNWLFLGPSHARVCKECLGREAAAKIAEDRLAEDLREVVIATISITLHRGGALTVSNTVESAEAVPSSSLVLLGMLAAASNLIAQRGYQ